MPKQSYRIPTGNRVTISKNLEQEIKKRFENDRENRFQLFLLSSGIRNKYLNKKTNKYSDDFLKWYKTSGMVDLFGLIPNFTKYSSSGDVIHYVGNHTSDPEKYLKKLPLSVGSLYEISMILKMSKDLFKVCLHFTPTRKSVDDPKHEWVTKRPSLINKNSSELKIRIWRRKWENPPPPKVKRTDKRTLPFVTITCSGELFDFDKKTGDKTGVLDLDEVESFFTKLTKFFKKEAPDKLQFRLDDHMENLTEGYYKRKERVDPGNKVNKKSKTVQRYK
ncbi:MAG: hypothetical protein HOK91_19735 [Gammaproteobacteria bacterium]|nr:hypothetical protein [Gammaproteobacteria bacterium]